MFDTHTHTSFSCDARMSSLDAIEQAKKLGLGMIITEHLDLDYPENPEEFMFDFGDYFKTLNPFRSDNMLLGIELGLRCGCSDKNRELLLGWQFDEVIGSIHVVDDLDIYRPSFTKSRPKQTSYGRYLDAMLECVKEFDDFDTLGHVDYICRYSLYEDQELYLDEFYEQWTAICQALVQKGKALEINTRRLADPAACAALKRLYQRYAQLGGKFVTIGSDAHRLTEIGARFDIAWAMAEELRLQPVYFKERKMYFDRR